MLAHRKSRLTSAIGARLVGIGLLVLFGAFVDSPSPAQVVAPPFSATSQMLTTLQSELRYTVDLGALSLRPRLVVEVEPDASHPDMEYEITISDCTLGASTCPGPSSSACFDPIAPGIGDPRWVLGSGEMSAYYDLVTCCGGPQYTGQTCDVVIRPLGFGTAGIPATVDVSIRGETRVPTASVEIEVDPTPLLVSRLASKDTTLYQANINAGNGLGESIWVSAGTGTDAMHGLIAFDLTSIVPAESWIRDVEIRLSVLAASPGASFALYAVPDGLDWLEGTTNASGDESTPPAPGIGPHASWAFRRWTLLLVNPGPWITPGGDREPEPLVTATVSSSGSLSLSSNALLEHVRAIQSGTTTSDGFLLVPLSGAVRFGSAENALFANVPQLFVEHTGPPIQTGWSVGTQPFFSERQNFRWVYDAENDHAVLAQAGTMCVSLEPLTTAPFSNYTHQYRGSAEYRGLDCCTWQVGSSTGVTGTGQALFYIGLDPDDPANDPVDSDLDGMVDVCDNCIHVPNGPLAGTCLFGPREGQACLSDQECLNAPCSLAQEDIDRDGAGDACPEPGTASSIAVGLLGLGLLGRRRSADAAKRPAVQAYGFVDRTAPGG